MRRFRPVAVTNIFTDLWFYCKSSNNFRDYAQMQIQPMPTQTGVAGPSPDAGLREAAEQLEASFLSEMLKAAGLGKTIDGFGGGAGEDQFSSFLVQAQAEEMVRAGGIGLAEAIFNALKERENAGQS